MSAIRKSLHNSVAITELWKQDDEMTIVDMHVFYSKFSLFNAEKYEFTCLPIPLLVSVFIE